MSIPPIFIEMKTNAGETIAKLGEARKEVEKLGKQGGDSMAKLEAVGKGAFLGLAAGAVGFGAIAIKVGLDQEAANARLTTALHNTGSAMTALSKPVEEAESSMRQLGFANGDTTDAMTKLVNATKSPTKAIQDLSLAADVARGRNIDLSTATDLLVKVETGHVALLGRLGINVKDATGATISQEEALKRLSAMYGGQASAYADTFAGRMQVLKAQVENVGERVGMYLIPKIEELVAKGNSAITWAENHTTAMKVLAGVIGGPLVLAMAAYIKAQIVSTAESAAQIALPVAKFFLGIGAALEGASAEAIIANGNFAALSSTFLLGAGSAGLLAAGFLRIHDVQNRGKDAGKDWAADQVAGFGTVADKLAETNRLIDVWKANLKKEQGPGGQFGGTPWIMSFFGKQSDSDTALNNLKGLQAQSKALGKEMGAEAGAAKAADEAIGPDGLSGAQEKAAASAQKFAQQVDALKNDIVGVLTATKAHKDAQTAVTTATDAQSKAQEDLNTLLKQGAVDAKAVESAQKALATASKSVVTAQDDLVKAQQDLNTVMAGSSPEDLGKATLDYNQSLTSQQKARLATVDAEAAYQAVLKDSTKTALDRQKASLDVTDAAAQEQAAAFGVTDAQKALTAAQNAGKPGSADLAAAQQNVAQKTDALTTALDAQTQATLDLQTAQAGDPAFDKKVSDAKDALAKAVKGVGDAKDNLAQSSLKLFDAQTKENQSLQDNADAIGNVHTQLDSFIKAYPDAASLGGGLLALLSQTTGASGGSAINANGGTGAVPYGPAVPSVTVNVNAPGIITGSHTQVATALAQPVLSAIATIQGRGGGSTKVLV